MKKKFKLILGTMTFGPQVNNNDADVMVQYFLDEDYEEIDTAYVYNEGKSEVFLGNAINKIENDNIKVATKVNPRISGKLDAKAVKSQLLESLDRLQVDMVETLYLHFPDSNTPIEETLKACSELYEEGKFKELGLSNFPAWMVVDTWHICKNNRWPVPTVYQGVYNGLSRNAESELFQALRTLGMRFYAYNPLAGGILSGKYKNFTKDPEKGRFTYRTNYLDRYWKESFFDAYNLINNKCIGENIPIIEAAFRWLMHHSLLDPNYGDGIIVGASSLEQLKQNLEIGKKGILPKSIVDAFEQAWEETRSESPEYFRFITK